MGWEADLENLHLPSAPGPETAHAAPKCGGAIRRPIFLGVGDDVRSIVAPGLEDCTAWQHPPNPRGSPASREGDLAGSHGAVMAYATSYNRRLLRLAPRQAAAACRRTVSLALSQGD
jgi:hypothetical protein